MSEEESCCCAMREIKIVIAPLVIVAMTLSDLKPTAAKCQELWEGLN